MGDYWTSAMRVERVPYDVNDPATFDAWLASDDGLTLDEFAERGYTRWAYPEAPDAR